MKHDAKWVEETAECPDGLAWGLDYVKDGGKTPAEAVKGFDRADFLLWYMVRADLLDIVAACDLCDELANNSVSSVLPANFAKLNLTELKAQITWLGQMSETCMVAGDFKRGHELAATAFLARFHKRIRENDKDEALKDGQCVLNNLVAARTGSLNFTTPAAKRAHGDLCHWLRDRVILAK